MSLYISTGTHNLYTYLPVQLDRTGVSIVKYTLFSFPSVNYILNETFLAGELLVKWTGSREWRTGNLIRFSPPVTAAAAAVVATPKAELFFVIVYSSTLTMTRRRRRRRWNLIVENAECSVRHSCLYCHLLPTERKKYLPSLQTVRHKRSFLISL